MNCLKSAFSQMACLMRTEELSWFSVFFIWVHEPLLVLKTFLVREVGPLPSELMQYVGVWQ